MDKQDFIELLKELQRGIDWDRRDARRQSRAAQHKEYIDGIGDGYKYANYRVRAMIKQLSK